MDSLIVAKELIRIAALLSSGSDDRDDYQHNPDKYDYIYDPHHKKHPKGGGWNKTDEGWSRWIPHALKKTKYFPVRRCEMCKKMLPVSHPKDDPFCSDACRYLRLEDEGD